MLIGNFIQIGSCAHGQNRQAQCLFPVWAHYRFDECEWTWFLFFFR
jgi:hypothetical protein